MYIINIFLDVEFVIHIASNVPIYSADMPGCVSIICIKTKWHARYKMKKETSPATSLI